MCANVDLTTFYPLVKRRGVSFTAATAYVLARAANAIPEFRYRIRPGEVVEHEVVHPNVTILGTDDVFGFCPLPYVEDFSSFASTAAQQIAFAREHPTLQDEPGRDDWLFMSAVPWVTFTSVTHPIHLQPADSIPRFAWGKFFEDGRRLKMPLSVQVHHGLMDGVHMGRYYGLLQEYLDHPDSVLGE
jgi:chloramphenicol O-acetyltransferase type A